MSNRRRPRTIRLAHQPEIVAQAQSVYEQGQSQEGNIIPEQPRQHHNAKYNGRTGAGEQGREVERHVVNGIGCKRMNQDLY
jgi:hypothetical protein